MTNIPTLPPDAIPLVKAYLLELQQSICQTLETLDGVAKFKSDLWTRSEGGGGLSKIIEKGALFEKGGVNFSHVMGLALPPAATAKRAWLAHKKFQALGVSLVIHPENPYVPTTHANLRFIIAEEENEAPHWWFGGGCDLTPYYGFDEDCQHWHQVALDACRPFGEEIYPHFKKACDDYFYLPHREEARGIGGLFFDDYHQISFEHSFELTKSIGNHLMQGYLPIVKKRKSMPYGAREKNFQCYRRGRYVEFNLIYDRGTHFGLQSKGRTESILMSLPPEVHWRYNYKPEEGSDEARLYSHYLPRRDWVKPSFDKASS